jgi:hypothetical protein
LLDLWSCGTCTSIANYMSLSTAVKQAPWLTIFLAIKSFLFSIRSFR